MTDYHFSIDFYYPRGASERLDPHQRHACAVASDRRMGAPIILDAYHVGSARSADGGQLGTLGLPQAMALYRVAPDRIGFERDEDYQEVSTIHGIALTWARVFEYAHQEVLAEERARAGHERHVGFGQRVGDLLLRQQEGGGPSKD
jgi:hypothetical protein